MLFRILTTILIISSSILINGQIRFENLPDKKNSEIELDYLESSGIRKNYSLGGEWQAALLNSDKKVSVIVPSVFEGDCEIVFEKKVNLPFNENSDYRIHFLGVSYSAEIFFNEASIYKHQGGEYPFVVNIPRDLIKNKGNNSLKVILAPNLNHSTTIPFKNSFLFPGLNKGIFREVYIREIPAININDYVINAVYDPSSNKANIKARISLLKTREFKDSINSGGNYRISVSLNSTSVEGGLVSANESFTLERGKNKESNLSLDISSPNLFTPSTPNGYIVTIKLFQGEKLVDEVIQKVSIFNLTVNESGLTLNGEEFTIYGVSYIPSQKGRGGMLSYEEMYRDIKMIKDLGFNSVRFEKRIPHPYLLDLCSKFGLLVFIELPVYLAPDGIISNSLYRSNLNSFVKLYSKAYRSFHSIAAIGLGESYDGNSLAQIKMLEELSAMIKTEIPKLVYANFATLPLKQVDALDAYGLEFLNESIENIELTLIKAENRFGKGRTFIGSAGFIANGLESSGYTPHSYEAQAKYYEQIFEIIANNDLPAIFVSTMFDYESSYNSIISGFGDPGTVYSGIVGDDRTTNRPVYRVIDYKLNNKEKVTIALGFESDDSPMIFIVVGLALALFTGLLINTGKKFREDASRAISRPYNFYADIRDLRLMSTVITFFLSLIISALFSLFFASLLHSWRYSVIFEKFIISSGITGFINFISYLSWNPTEALLILMVLFLILGAFTVLVIRVCAMFVMHTVSILNSYYVAVWSLIPLLILLPLAIVLYRLLAIEAISIYIYGFLVLFAFYLFFRLLKGVYVVFDTTPGKVYFYGTTIVIVITGIWLLYLQMNYSTLDFLVQNFKNYQSGY